MHRLTALIFGCVASLAAAPSVTRVYNAGSWLPPALTNSGIAQGSIFTVVGTGMGPAALQQATKYPLPTTQGLGGTTVQVSVGGTTETCIMIYTVATQIAAILPSATPLGTGTLTVTYQGGSSSVPITVVAANFGTFTLNEGGSGPAVVTDTSYNPITMINAAHPGDSLILWGTGLGAVTGDETMPPVEMDLGTGVRVFVGNQPATVLYGGRSSSSGLDQINFVVPAGVQGCKTSVAVLVKGITGNVTSTSIAPAGQTTCGDTHGALTAANLQKAITSGTLNVGGVQLSRVGTGNDDLGGAFVSFPVNTLIRSYGGTLGPSIGSCIAYEVLGTSLVVQDPVQLNYLAAGPSLMLTGPAGAKTVGASSTGVYAATLATSPSVYVEPGSYTVSNGSGGSSVGAFSWTLTLPSPVVPNIPASIDRSQDLTLTWTGGSAFPVVTIFGYAGLEAGGGLKSYIEFICNAEGSAGQFTVPSVILNMLPSNGYGTPTEAGVNIQVAGFAVMDLTAPGLDEGVFSAFVTNGSVAKIQ
jgi:uncharacterized protein (TIGR03437 family)